MNQKPLAAPSPRFALVLVVVLAGVLRFGTLGAKSFWSDEGLTVADVSGSFGRMWDLLATLENTPPLYFVLQWAWSKAFGLSEVGVRSLSALLGTLTVLVTYAVARRLLSHRPALIASFLLAVNPLLVWHSQEARSYALLMFLGAMSLLFFVLALQTGRTKFLVAWTLVSVLLFYTHYFAFPLVAAEGAWLLAQRFTRWRTAVALASIAVLTAPLMLILSPHGDTDWVTKLPFVGRLIVTPVTLLIGFEAPVPIFFALVASVLAAMSVALLARRGTAQERRSALIATSICASVIAFPIATRLLGYDLLINRYVLLAVVPMTIVISAGLGTERARRLGPPVAAALGALSLVIHGLTAWTPKHGIEDWRAMAVSLREDRVEKLILLYPRGGARTLAVHALGAYLQPVAAVTNAAGVEAREVNVVSVAHRIAGQTVLPPPDPTNATVLARAGFRLIESERHRTYAIARYRANDVRRVPAAALAPGTVLPGYQVVLRYTPVSSYTLRVRQR